MYALAVGYPIGNEAKMEVKVEHDVDHHYAVVHVDGDLCFSTVNEFNDVGLQLVEHTTPIIGINLRAVGFMDSTGIGSCIKLLTVCLKLEKKLYLIDSSDSVLNILEASGLINKFNLVSSKEFTEVLSPAE